MLLGSPVTIDKDWPPHAHEAHELIVCGSKNAVLEVNGSQFPFHNGRTFIIKAGVSHHFEVLPGKLAKAHLICFDDTQLDKYTPPTIRPLKQELFSGGFSIACEKNIPAKDILQTTEHLNKAMNHPGRYHREIAGSLFSLLLFQHLAALNTNQRSQTDLHNEKINKVVDWINQHLTEEITIDIAATQANMSRAVFTKYFRKNTGMSLTEYLSHSRLQLSVSLLADSRTSITEIAYQSGYKNLGYFYKNFQKNFSMTPNQFRQMLLSQRNAK